MNCPRCGAKSVATKVVRQLDGSETTHGYCPNCHPPHFPPVPGHWSPYDADWEKSIKKDPETVKERRERMQGRSPWG